MSRGRGAARCFALASALLAAFPATVAAPALAAPGQGDPAPAAAGAVVARTVLALYDSREEDRIRLSRIHTMAEMPLNHLGLSVVYRDVSKGLPDLAQWPDLRGIVTWFAGPPFDDPARYVAWVEQALDRGVRVATLGQAGVRSTRDGTPAPKRLIDRFLGRFGLDDRDGFTTLTYQARPVLSDPAMIGYERPLNGVLPGFPRQGKVDDRFTSHLVLRRGGNPDSDSHLVVTGPTGGLVAEGFARHYDAEFNRKFWLIDPFAFFRAAFATDAVPKPDVTTLSGRRLYFSHIDGDGWRNVTEVLPYADDGTLSAEVVLREAIEPYPDLPVSVAPIAADLDPAWAGSEETRRVARRLFALPQVETASHTWTHPFMWSFFKDYAPGSEDAYRTRSPSVRTSGGALARLLGKARELEDNVIGEGGGDANAGEGGGALGHYARPRAYLKEPFDLDREIAGSLAYMDTLAPPGKPARLMQWSGDTSPFEAALAATRRAGAVNLNGGDTRMDPEYPSYTSVSAIGLPVGAERQIYAAASNENTYTDLWSNRFFGFQNLVRTIENTETPIRVKPFNIYYHMYSGQKLASLNALRKNLDHARRSELAPVTAATYAAMAGGFYTTRLLAEGEGRWRVLDRGALSTLRFDHATFRTVDFDRSIGVLGQRHHQGSLYVALDPAVEEPVVALAGTDRADIAAPAARPYLEHGRWSFAGLAVEANGFTVTARGFGAGEMVWRMPAAGAYEIAASRDGEELWHGRAETGDGGSLAVTVDADAIRPLTLRVTQAGS